MSHVVERLDHPSSYKDHHARVGLGVCFRILSVELNRGGFDRNQEMNVKQD